jgi:hypothetical protein
MNLEALRDLATCSPTRECLQLNGYLPLHANADLHDFGYTIRHWFHPTTKDHWLEYRPRLTDLPVIILQTYEKQKALHLAIGACVCEPGEDYKDMPLFRGMVA